MTRLLLIFVTGLAAAEAHDIITTRITWSKEISRLVYKRCASCHREGGAAPMSLLSYEEARPWAKAIKEEVLERRMPPWGAVKGFGEFKDDQGLTQEEIELIAEWVEGGAPEGDKIYLPAKPRPETINNVAAPQRAAEIDIAGSAVLQGPARIVAIRPKNLRPGASVQVVARRPDGAVEPLIWLHQFRPAYRRTYYFRSPLAVPAGTLVEMSPPAAGTLAVFVRKETGGGSRASGLADNALPHRVENQLRH